MDDRPGHGRQTYTQHFTFTNLFGAFKGAATGTSLGSAFRRARRRRLRPGRDDPTQQFPIAVPTGATSLHVEIGNPAETNTDLDLFLFDPRGNLVAQSAGSSAHEQVTIANPVAGTYTAVVDDFAVGGSGTTQYDYTDVYLAPEPRSDHDERSPRTMRAALLVGRREGDPAGSAGRRAVPPGLRSGHLRRRRRRQAEVDLKNVH